MTKEKENRFDGLMGAVRGKTNAQTSKRSDAQTSRHLDAQTSRTKTSQQSSSQSDSLTSENLSIQTSKRLDVQKSRTKTSPPSSATDDAPTSKPRNDSDFKSESQAEVHSAHSSIQTSKKAKSANPDYMRTTIYLPKKMHKKLKAIAIEEEKEMSSIVEELISAWLISQS